MNCMRCLESIMKLDKAYRKYGLNAVLVHPSEWEFEKSKENIAMAAKDLGISLPIIVDRDRRIIKGMGVNFWPAQILFHDGKAIYRHIGEGEYKKLEDIRTKKNIIYFAILYTGGNCNSLQTP